MLLQAGHYDSVHDTLPSEWKEDTELHHLIDYAKEAGTFSHAFNESISDRQLEATITFLSSDPSLTCYSFLGSCHRLRGRRYLQSNDLSSALQESESAYALSHDLPSTCQLVTCLLQSDDIDRAISILEKSLRHEEHSETRHLLETALRSRCENSICLTQES